MEFVPQSIAATLAMTAKPTQAQAPAEPLVVPELGAGAEVVVVVVVVVVMRLVDEPPLLPLLLDEFDGACVVVVVGAVVVPDPLAARSPAPAVAPTGPACSGSGSRS